MYSQIRFITAGAWVALALLAAPSSFARTAACALDQSISAKELPKQGRDALDLIVSGGPFSSNRDGIAFSNRERILPKQPRGFYREYTVRTPGVKNRGARRIVCGGDQRAADLCYYSDDHYQSFKCIAR
jgi:ribonuclease T1